jgi:DNA-binding CsgD family transcriptional regulator
MEEMMECSTGISFTPTTLDELPIDDGAWQDIRRFADAEGTHRVARSALVRTEEGTSVYVVVVEAEALPPAGLIRTRFRLTEREAEVALLLARRMSGPEIAVQLGVTIHTARRHTEQILMKLGIRDRLAVRATLTSLLRAAAA